MPIAVQRSLQTFAPGLPLLVGFSGGADSTALLLACAQRWPGQVVALHVHHGLQKSADAFAAHCVSFCATHGIPLHLMRVDAKPLPGQSPEDAARIARQQAFVAAVSMDVRHEAIKNIAIAHHADDQVETMLLALSRGAGLPGLSAMPRHAVRDGLNFWRPFVDVPGADLRRWLVARHIHWIEDPTNAETRFTRNRIRARLMPALEAAFPQFRATFARSARHAAQAQGLLDEVAAQDLLAVGIPPAITPLRTLSAARQGNCIRYWLKSQFHQQPSTAQLDELLRQLAACNTRGHRIRIKLGTGLVERRRDVLHWYNP